MRRSGRAAIAAAAVITVIVSPALAAPAPGHTHGAAARQQALNAYLSSHDGTATANRTSDDGDLADQQAAYANERTAPGTSLSGAALLAAANAAQSLPTSGSSWSEVTTAPYQAQPANFTDPFWGNEGAGFSIVGGRTTALTQAPDGTWFAGTADGGVWISSDQGAHWTPTFDAMPSLSIGALAVDPADGSVWVGTGEANTSQDSYAGTGVYRTSNDGTSYQRVGDDVSGNNPLVSRTTFQLTFDAAGDAYAATNDGLWRMAAGSNTWVDVLDPVPGAFPPYPNQATSVQVVPGTGGADVIAAVGWRSADLPTNGFYLSTDGGNTFAMQTLTGAINAADIGRTTFAYSADGTKLYATVEAPSTVTLQGIFVSTGTPASVAGPWVKIADSAKLANSGSASPTFGSPGEQAWYNQVLAVDPANPNHVYAGLEEVYQTTDGGTTWTTAAPYWNYNFACDYTSPAPTCPNTTHPDQHAMMITDGLIVSGNDGGVYSRSLSDAVGDDGNWSDLNATLHDLQYYDARAGRLGHGVGVWGGLQDNGTSVIVAGSSQMNEPAGGDGFDVIVNPSNANDMVGEYVDGTMYLSTDGGHSFADFISPTCVAQATTGLPGGPRSDCDRNARFVTPIAPDQQNKNVWLTGGQYVWVDSAGWTTSCTQSSCSWTPVYNTGAGHAVTALASTGGGSTVYAAWVAGGGNPGRAFGSGIATNYGGSWHQIDMSSLPHRYVAGLTVDPQHPGHVYAVFNGYSRRWIPGGGVGHVFESWNGGASWTDISGNLPDVAGDALVIAHGNLALATDVGAYTAAAGQGASTSWSRLGTGLPNTSINDLTMGPDGNLYAGTHGRGIWRIAF